MEMPKGAQVLEPEINKKKIKEEKNKLKSDQKAQRKEAKARAKELSAQAAELDEDESKPVVTILATALIVLVWLVILGLVIKLDVGGFGSGVLAPVLKDVPVINMILPKSSMGGTQEETGGEDYYGYTSLKEAVKQIKVLEVELELAQNNSTASSDDVDALKAEIARLKTFESNQVAFENVKNDFYAEVVYAENGPGADAYRKYYEGMDPATAEKLYREVVQQQSVSSKVKDYATAYSAMKPKEAAGIFEAMEDDLELASQILGAMGTEERGRILGAMTPEIAAKITKIMAPNE